MRQAIFTIAVTLLVAWTVGCVGMTVWYAPEAIEVAQQLANGLRVLQMQMAAPPQNYSDPEQLTGSILALWLFVSALTWNVVATPLGIIALIAKR